MRYTNGVGGPAGPSLLLIGVYARARVRGKWETVGQLGQQVRRVPRGKDYPAMVASNGLRLARPMAWSDAR